jgi:stearoyl-CoA desaturase (Delta-9 desaturase)
VNWITSSFLIGTALIAVIGLPIYLFKFGIDWFQFACSSSTWWPR